MARYSIKSQYNAICNYIDMGAGMAGYYHNWSDD